MVIVSTRKNAPQALVEQPGPLEMAPWLLEDVLLTLRSKEAFRRDSRVQEAGWGALAAAWRRP